MYEEIKKQREMLNTFDVGYFVDLAVEKTRDIKYKKIA